jgi:hypothetical protein
MRPIWLRRAGTVTLGWLKGFGRFWYHFVVGDDWTIAATVAFALVATWLLRSAGVAAWWLPPLAAVGVVGASLRRTTADAVPSISPEAAAMSAVVRVPDSDES